MDAEKIEIYQKFNISNFESQFMGPINIKKSILKDAELRLKTTQERPIKQRFTSIMDIPNYQEFRIFFSEFFDFIHKEKQGIKAQIFESINEKLDSEERTKGIKHWEGAVEQRKQEIKDLEGRIIQKRNERITSYFTQGTITKDEMNKLLDDPEKEYWEGGKKPAKIAPNERITTDMFGNIILQKKVSDRDESEITILE